MFKTITESEMDSALNFSWELYQHPETSSYPINMTRELMIERFSRSLKQDDEILLGYYKDSKLIAVINYYFIEEDKYLQTSGIFIKSDYSTIMDEFIAKLKKDYSGYTAIIEFPKENKIANAYCLEKQYRCKQSSTVMKLNPADFKPAKGSSCITRVTEDNFDEYAPFHDKYFEGFFWTSSKLKKVFNNQQNNWNMFYYKINGKIEGVSFIRRYEKDNSIEVYGLDFSPENKTKENVTALLSYSLQYCFEHISNVTGGSDFIDDDNNFELEAAKEIGFKYNNSYRCYEINL